MIAPLAAVYSRVHPQSTWDPLGAHFQVLKVLFDDCFQATVSDIQYSRQFADSYSPVHLNVCIDAVTVLTCYGSPWSALMRFILHRFPSFFKCTASLIDTNIWQCLLTILQLQSWTDFRWFTSLFLQEFDYNALFHANVCLCFASLPDSWQNCTVADTRLVSDLGTVLPPSTYYTFSGPRCIFELWTNYNSCLPMPRIGWVHDIYAVKRTLKHCYLMYDTRWCVNKHIDSMYLCYGKLFQITNYTFPGLSTFSTYFFKWLPLNLFNILI
jgi:hypothetical protein